MTVTTVNGSSVNYDNTSSAGSGLLDHWLVGDEDATTESHDHEFSNPISVIKINVSYLDDGDFAAFSYTDEGGTTHQIDLAAWETSGDAVVTLGSGHAVQTGTGGAVGLQGSNTTPDIEGGVTTIEFYFPQQATNFIIERAPVSGSSPTDEMAYSLFYDDEKSLPCFARGTLIETADGPRAVEELREGDLVRTRDNGLQRIRWVDSRRFSGAELAEALRPIVISADALGHGLPERDLVVSPQHRILVRSKIARRMFDADEVLVAAKHLLALDGIEIAHDVAEIEYFHMLFDRHEIIFSNGAETESFYTGAQAMRSLAPEARQEIFRIFPELRLWPRTLPAARPLVPGRKGRKLASRHLANGHMLISATG